MGKKIKLDEATLDKISALGSFQALSGKQAHLVLEYLRTGSKLDAVRAAYRVPEGDREAKMYAAVYFDSPRVAAFLNDVGVPQSDVLDLLDRLSKQKHVEPLLRAIAMVGGIALLGKSPSERTELLHQVEQKFAEVSA